MSADLSESDIQSQIVEYLSLMSDSFGFMFFSVPNEGIDRANPARLSKLKRMGFRAGVSDLVIIKNGEVFFLEVKRPHGKQSANQILFAGEAVLNDCPYEVVHSLDEAIAVLQYWLITA